MADFFMQIGKTLASVLVVGIILGAGLPAIYSLGMRSLMIGRALNAKGEPEGHATWTGKILAVLCFGIVLLAIAYGILIIIFGKSVLPH
ncbi:MAG: hypothetical protein ACRCWS_01390 [Propionibacteriaceae bacterium]